MEMEMEMELESEEVRPEESETGRYQTQQLHTYLTPQTPAWVHDE